MSDTIHRVNHEIRQRRLQVLRVTDLTPRMRRITLGGPELQGFTSLGSDDHIKLLFAETAEQQQAIDARNLGRDGGARPTMREYTPRRIDLVPMNWTSTSYCTAMAPLQPGPHRRHRGRR